MFRISGNDISITRGDTAIIDFSLNDYVLTDGDTVYFSVKKSVNYEESVIQKIITSFAGGKALIELSATDTDIEARSYVYDIQCNLADGRVDTVIGPAKFAVLEGVT